MSVSADEITYCTSIKPTQFNDIWKRHFESGFRISYETNKNEFIFYSSETLTLFGFSLNRAQADSLIKIIDKYIEWNNKAIAKKVKIEKEIATLPIWLTFWKMGDEWSMGTDTEFSFYFFSQTEIIHQLLFIFPKITSRSNEFDTHKGETLYFDFKNASKLRSVLLKENVVTFLAGAKKQAEIEKEFK